MYLRRNTKLGFKFSYLNKLRESVLSDRLAGQILLFDFLSNFWSALQRQCVIVFEDVAGQLVPANFQLLQ